jgi:hypothetical protein
MKTESIANIYPVTFVDYNMIVLSPGVIIFDEELNADSFGVKDGDKFEVRIKDGRISMFRI